MVLVEAGQLPESHTGKVETCRRGVTSPQHRHAENCSDFLTLGDFTWSATRSFKPLHKICDFDLMFDAHIRDGHLHKAERCYRAFAADNETTS